MESHFSIEELWMPALMTNAAGRIVDWNTNLEIFLGYRPDNITGKYCYHFLCEKNPSGAPSCLKASILQRVVCLKASVIEDHCRFQRKLASQTPLFRYAVIPIYRSKRRKDFQMLHLLQPAGLNSEIVNAGDSLAHSPFSHPPDPRLSLRECEVLRFLCEGYRTANIAEALFISVHTVRSHLQHIFRKMGVHDKLQAILQARKQKLI